METREFPTFSFIKKKKKKRFDSKKKKNKSFQTNFLFVYLFICSFSYINYNNSESIHSLNNEDTNCLNVNAISHVGFYNFSITKKCSITVLFNSGSVHMFLFFEPFNSNNFEITIDGKKIKTGSNYANGRLIDAYNNATIKFFNENYEEKKINIWLLPSNFCRQISLYAYGGYSIELKVPYTSSEICIFSPSFDSFNGKYKVNFGINSNQNNHISNLYSKSFYCPYKVGKFDEIVKAKVDEPFVAVFKFNSSLLSKSDNDLKYFENFIFYKRITDQFESNDSNKQISLGSVANCNFSNDCVTSFFPPLEVNVENKKWNSDIELIPLLIVLIASIVGVVLVVFCFKKIKRRIKLNSIKNDISGLIPAKPQNLDITDNNSIESNGNDLKNSDLIDEYFPDKNTDTPNNL